MQIMSETKIVVPSGIREAVEKVIVERRIEIKQKDVPVILEAALRWFDEELIELSVNHKDWHREESSGYRLALTDVRRMFLAPDEDEIPKEIKDLQWQEVGWSLQFDKEAQAQHNQQIIEAYRRGQQSK
jgi:hypothetical protein